MATRMKEAGFEWKAVAAVFTPEQLKCQVKYTDDLIRKVETVVFGQPVSG